MINTFPRNDLILFNPREKPSDHLDSKLSSDWLGPYEVIRQTKNDISARHIVLQSTAVLHVDRVKPFFGTRDEAIAIARYDQHQYQIVSFNFYTGNPFVRTSMSFNVTFEDGTIDMPYGGDFIYSEQFINFIHSEPELYPLRFTAKIAMQNIKQMEKLAILNFQPNMEAFVNIRIYDGRNSTWFDSLNLPSKSTTYTTLIRSTKWYNKDHLILEAIVPLFGPNHAKYTLYLTSYDLMAYVFPDELYWTHTLLTTANLNRYPQILRS